MCHSKPMKVRGQVPRVSSLLPPCRLEGSNWNAQTRQRMPLSSESFTGPVGSFFNTRIIISIQFSSMFPSFIVFVVSGIWEEQLAAPCCYPSLHLWEEWSAVEQDPNTGGVLISLTPAAHSKTVSFIQLTEQRPLKFYFPNRTQSSLLGGNIKLLSQNWEKVASGNLPNGITN